MLNRRRHECPRAILGFRHCGYAVVSPVETFSELIPTTYSTHSPSCPITHFQNWCSSSDHQLATTLVLVLLMLWLQYMHYCSSLKTIKVRGYGSHTQANLWSGNEATKSISCRHALCQEKKDLVMLQPCSCYHSKMLQ